MSRSSRLTARPVWGVLGLALVLTVGASACRSEAAHHAEAHGELPVTTPLRTDVVLDEEYVAQIRAAQHIELRALERGYLQDVFVDEGRAVREGAPMFQIMPMIYQAEVEMAEAEADFAAIEYRTTESLTAGKVVSENELALAKARLDRAKAEQSLAAAHLSLTEVRAPFDGIMGRLHVRKGSLLDEGELLTTLSDNSKMWVYFNVSEAEYLDYRVRMSEAEPLRAKLRLANGQLFSDEGIVETIEADFNPETGNIAFRATFANPSGLLRHGETGNVVISRTLPDALVIPQKATFDILDKKFVYVIDEEHIVHQREVRVIEELPHVYVVGGGLEDGEHVLLDGLRKVRDGHAITPEFEPPEEVYEQLAVLPAE